MTVIAHPWKNLTPGPYLYSRPSWDEPQLVDVFAGEGDFNGCLMIRHQPGLIPARLSDTPVDGLFEPSERTVVVAAGVLDAWRQPAVKGLRSEDVGPFVQALTRRLTGRLTDTTNVVPALEAVLMATNGMDVTISVTVRPNQV